jgi:general stress protein 26
MTAALLRLETPMTEPTTTLNQTYSDPTATALPWDETQRILETAELFWVSTVRADGRPHVTPCVAVWMDGAVWFSTGVEEQKFANMRANPHVVMTTGCNGWQGGVDVVVEGKAEQVTDDAVLAPVAAAFASKWDGRWKWIARDGAFRDSDNGHGGAMAFKVVPVKVFAHAKGETFGATAHRFKR